MEEMYDSDNSAIKDALAVAKTKALEAEAKSLEAEAEKALAEAQRALAEAAQKQAETRSAIASAEAVEIGLQREQEKRARELAHDYFQRVYRFTDMIGPQSVEGCMKTLTEWSRLSPGCDIEIVLCSPGGNVIAGFALYDFIRDLQSKGHFITTRSLGYAASMAGVLLQVGDKRIMSKEAWLLIHQGSGGAAGSMGEVEDTVEWFKKMTERMLDIFYERSKKAHPSKPLTKVQLKKHFDRKDWWLSSDQCLDHGFCDEIA